MEYESQFLRNFFLIVSLVPEKMGNLDFLLFLYPNLSFFTPLSDSLARITKLFRPRFSKILVSVKSSV